MKKKYFEVIKVWAFIANSDEYDFWNFQLRRWYSQTLIAVLQKIPIGYFNFLKKVINNAEEICMNHIWRKEHGDWRRKLCGNSLMVFGHLFFNSIFLSAIQVNYSLMNNLVKILGWAYSVFWLYFILVFLVCALCWQS